MELSEVSVFPGTSASAASFLSAHILALGNTVRDGANCDVETQFGRYSSSKGLCGESMNWNTLTLGYRIRDPYQSPCVLDALLLALAFLSGLTQLGNLLTMDRGFWRASCQNTQSPLERTLHCPHDKMVACLSLGLWGDSEERLRPGSHSTPKGEKM